MIKLSEIAQSIKEADKYGSKSIGKEDGDTWDTAKGRAGKYKGKIRYFDGDNSDDDADAYAKSGKVSGEAGGDKEKEKPSGKKISGGDFDRDGGDKPFDPKSDGPHQGGSHFDRNDMEVESPNELDDFVDKYADKLNDEQKNDLEDIKKKIEVAYMEYGDDPDALKDEISQYWGEIEDIANRTRNENKPFLKKQLERFRGLK